MTSHTSGYARMISDAIQLEDPDTLALVENLMREQTGGVLDHLTARQFAKHARDAYSDARAWDTSGAVNGFTLADYCRASGITPPRWTREP
ncbi:hypothetical protein GCM10028801_44880 [Nocardioides maradonensis]